MKRYAYDLDNETIAQILDLKGHGYTIPAIAVKLDLEGQTVRHVIYRTRPAATS